MNIIRKEYGAMSDKSVDLKQVQTIVSQYATDYYVNTYSKGEKTYYPKVFEVILEETMPCKALDIGPGWGTGSVWLSLNGYKVTAIDKRARGYYPDSELWDEYSINYLEKDVVAHHIPSKYGLVVMTQVLPHLKWHPSSIIHKVRMSLSENGVFIYTANIGGDKVSAYANWRDVPHYSNDKMPTEEIVTTYYNYDDLVSLMAEAFEDFTVQQIGETNTLIGVAWY